MHSVQNRCFVQKPEDLDDATKQETAFRQRFQDENNVDVKLYAPYVYDATMILVEAMRKADSTDPKIFSSQISKGNYLGVTGPISLMSLEMSKTLL